MIQFRSIDDGRSWRNEGRPMSRAMGSPDFRGSLDHCVAGKSIFVPVITPAEGTKKSVYLLRSRDEGRSWERAGAITEGSNLINETGILHLGGDKLMVVARASQENATYLGVSEDLGETWGPMRDISEQVGVVQQPNLIKLSNQPGRIYLAGRARKKETAQRNGLWWSDNLGQHWQGGVLDEQDFIDTGYGDMLSRSDGNMVYLAYRGRDSRAETFSYVFRVPSKP